MTSIILDMKTSFFFSVLLAAALSHTGFVKAADSKLSRDEKVHKDRDELKDDDHWIYNDFAKAKEIARESNKPLLIVFRCIP